MSTIAQDPKNIGRKVRVFGRTYTIEAVNWLGDYDIYFYEDRADGRYKIGTTCVLGLEPNHPHYAELVEEPTT